MEAAALRASLRDARRRFKASSDDGRVAEIDWPRATLELDGTPFEVLDLVANRAAPSKAVLEISFCVDPLAIPRFVKLATPIRIKFPFGESTYVASCPPVRFRMIATSSRFGLRRSIRSGATPFR